MCQFTQLKKVEPQKISAERECKIFQVLLTNITAKDANKKSNHEYVFYDIHKKQQQK